MINLIYFLAPTKIIDDFPKKCSLNTKCTRIADTKNRGYGLEIIKLKSDVSNIQKIMGIDPSYGMLEDRKSVV